MAEKVGELLANAGVGVIFGGGRIGLMGVLADSVLAAGGEVISVIPDYLRSEEVEHTGVTTRHIVDDLFERKALMMREADGFLALPGGLGTYDELLEVMTWRQLKQHLKPIGILNVAGYFDPFLQTVRRAQEEGFVPEGQLEMLLMGTDPAPVVDDLLDAIGAKKALMAT